MLATAGDDGNTLLWVPADTHHPTRALGEDELEDKETWRIKHMCRSSTAAEIYDLAWSPDGVFFITGSLDNVARIYSAQTGGLTSVAVVFLLGLTDGRSNGAADSRAQSLRARRSLGSPE